MALSKKRHAKEKAEKQKELKPIKILNQRKYDKFLLKRMRKNLFEYALVHTAVTNCSRRLDNDYFQQRKLF